MTAKFSNFFVYDEVYNWKNVLKILRLLDSTVDTLKEVFVQYLFQVKISSHLASKIAASKFAVKYTNYDSNIYIFLNIKLFIIIFVIRINLSFHRQLTLKSCAIS